MAHGGHGHHGGNHAHGGPHHEPHHGGPHGVPHHEPHHGGPHHEPHHGGPHHDPHHGDHHAHGHALPVFPVPVPVRYSYLPTTTVRAPLLEPRRAVSSSGGLVGLITCILGLVLAVVVLVFVIKYARRVMHP